MARKLPLQIRVDPRLESGLKKLARKSRRSITAEVNHIIESFLSIHYKPE